MPDKINFTPSLQELFETFRSFPAELKDRVKIIDGRLYEILTETDPEMLTDLELRRLKKYSGEAKENACSNLLTHFLTYVAQGKQNEAEALLANKAL